MREVASESSAWPLLGEQLFRDTLLRERRRAERADRTLVVLLVTLERRDSGAGDAWRELVAAVAASKCGTDVVGWFNRRHTLGIILGGEPRHPFDTHNSELFRALEAEAVRGFSIRLCVHPPSAPTFDEAPPRRYDPIKRLLDIVLSVMLLMLLSPILLIVAALVRATSRGPVLFKQQRIGRMMQPFVMLKFRTMEVNAAPAIHQEFVSAFITGRQEDGTAEANRLFKIVKDPRLTSIGDLLRRTSLDELPQLWNVLRGDMSLVGPRPPLPYEVAQYKTWHLRRIGEAKPGLTGLWQVKGRSRTTFDDMVRLDLRYVRTRSFWTDLNILLETPRAVISGKGAC
jgi:lipopolysaccharide/colanic/teichoic acid biosynthesis glycosyltransferase